jgi:ubiquinone/menaquinone biosynthesis C-methylase UbiE
VSAGQSIQVARLLDAALQELHVSISRRLSSASNDYFTNQADAYASSRSHSQHGLERIAALLECQRGSRVLDIGTGPGHAALRLAEDGLTIDAVDPCARMLRVGAHRSMERGLSESVRFYQAEATALPFIDDLFDGAIARMTTHHVWNLASALEEVRRTVKSGGQFVIIDNIGPEDRELFRHVERLERLKDSSHARLYSLAGRPRPWPRSQLQHADGRSDLFPQRERPAREHRAGPAPVG